MTTYDPAEAERLITEAREDDARMVQIEGHERAPWRAVEATRKDIGRLRHYVTCIPEDHPCWSGNDMVAWSRLGIWTSDGVTEQVFAEAIARTRNNLRAMADQLEAARADVVTIRTAHSADLARLRSDLDDARKVAAAAVGDGAVRRWEESLRIQQRQELHIRDLVTERDAARAEVERLRPIVEAVAGASVDQPIGSVKVYTVGDRAQYLLVAAAQAVRKR